MSYKEALEAAGAEVHQYKDFGSYQGDWFALVTYKGERGWVSGSYGSCSGCDAFEGEFTYSDYPECEEHRYTGKPGKEECASCQALTAAYQTKLSAFGKTYLDGVDGEGTCLQTQENLLIHLDSQADWDSESREAAAWIRTQK